MILKITYSIVINLVQLKKLLGSHLMNCIKLLMIFSMNSYVLKALRVLTYQ